MALRDRFDLRHNNFDLLRLAFAAVVAVSHGIVMHTGDQPRVGDSTLGDFALDGFFVLSGFLVCRSYLRLASLGRFVWHRFLRIMPGFWVCLLVVAFVVAPIAALLEGRPASTPFTEPPTAWRFLEVNAGLLMREYGIAGLFADSPTPLITAGSLWTLSIEAACYALLAVLGVLSVLRRRAWAVPVLAGTLWVLMVAQEAGLAPAVGDQTIRLALMFTLGATAYLYAHRIPVSGALAAVALAVFAVSAAGLDNYRILGSVAFAYLLLWLGVALPRTVRVRSDLSYGVYVYHWPLEQLLMLTGAQALPTAGFLVLSLAGVVVPAALSWHFVERPVLSLKSTALPWRRRADRRLAAEQQPAAAQLPGLNPDPG